MSDFLSRLLSRSFAVEPALHARLPSRFEPLRPDVGDEDVPGRPANAAPQPGMATGPGARNDELDVPKGTASSPVTFVPRPRDDAGPLRPFASTHRPSSPATRSTSTTTRAHPAGRAIEAETVEPDESTPAHPREPGDGESVSPVAACPEPTRVIVGRSFCAPPGNAVERGAGGPESDPADRTVTEDGPPPVANRTDRNDASPRILPMARATSAVDQNAPIVTISIGRVEIRGPAVPARTAPSRTPPRLTLEDYLRQRSGGRS